MTPEKKSSTKYAVTLLGAEKQAATSLALAYPTLSVLGLSDQPVIEGWDVTNLKLERESPGGVRELGGSLVVPLCGRWAPRAPRLAERLGVLAAKHPKHVLAVSASAPAGKPWIAKGDAWHRPDVVVTGDEPEAVRDPYGCGVVYQERLPEVTTVLAVGRRTPSTEAPGAGALTFGLVRAHREAFGREDFLLAGETVRHAELEHLTRVFTDELSLDGFFTMNWLESADGRLVLSSVRPVPRAVFRTLLEAGVDLLKAPAKGTLVAASGRRFVHEVHYSSYTPL